MKLKIVAAFLTICLILSGLVVFADSGMQTDIPISVTVNNSYIKMDAKPFLYKNSTYVPIRFVSEAIGADQVEWDAQNNTAVIQYDGNKIELPIDKSYGYVNGKYTAITNGVKLMSDRTFVPVRFVSEMMGATVAWEQDYLNVKISKSDVSVPTSLIENKSYSRDDIYWMSRIISAESVGEPMEGKIAVGNVVLNRVKSPDFPNTVHDVIFDSNGGIQFQPVMNGTVNNKPSGDSVIAAIRSLEGERVVGNSLFFFNPDIASSTWIARSRTYDTTIGNHDFYL